MGNFQKSGFDQIIPATLADPFGGGNNVQIGFFASATVADDQDGVLNLVGHNSGFRVQGSGFRVQGSGFREIQFLQ